MIALDAESEKAAGHGVFWRKGVLAVFLVYSLMSSALGLVNVAMDARRLAHFGPDFFAVSLSLLASLVFGGLLPYSERVENGKWAVDAFVLAAGAGLYYLLARADYEVASVLCLLASLAVYVLFLFLYPFAHRLDTGRWRSDMLLVLGVFAGLGVLIYSVWMRAPAR